MRDDAQRTLGPDPAASSASEAAPVDVCATAIAELVRLILELTSTNAAIDYTNGARVREELEHGLREALQTFEALPEGRARAELLGRLDGLRVLANRQLAIAPAPSAAAIEAALAGDSSLWFAEADDWAAERLRHGSSQRQHPRPPRRDTRPESPSALRVEALDPSHATTRGPLAPVASTISPPLIKSDKR